MLLRFDCPDTMYGFSSPDDVVGFEVGGLEVGCGVVSPEDGFVLEAVGLDIVGASVVIFVEGVGFVVRGL